MMDYRTWLYFQYNEDNRKYLDNFWNLPWPKKTRPIDNIRTANAISIRTDYFADNTIEHSDNRELLMDMDVNYLEVITSLIFNCELLDTSKFKSCDRLDRSGRRNLMMSIFIGDTIKKASSPMMFKQMMNDFAKGKFKLFLKYPIKRIDEMSINDQFFLYLDKKRITKADKNTKDKIIRSIDLISNPSEVTIHIGRGVYGNSN